MSNDIRTVRVAAGTPSGYAVINEHDFDASRHTLYAEAGDRQLSLPADAQRPAAPAKRPYNRRQRMAPDHQPEALDASPTPA